MKPRRRWLAWPAWCVYGAGTNYLTMQAFVTFDTKVDHPGGIGIESEVRR